MWRVEHDIELHPDQVPLLAPESPPESEPARQTSRKSVALLRQPSAGEESLSFVLPGPSARVGVVRSLPRSLDFRPSVVEVR